MNKAPTTMQEPSDADEAFGSAIGSAIDAHVNAPVQAPPISLIAKRAESQARARAAQRTVVGIAASITLLAGAVVTYNTFGSDGRSPTVATEPTIADPVDSTPETAPTADPALSQDAPPPLVFNEHDPAELFPTGFYGVEGIETVGDGRVVARAHGDAGTSLIITDNGEDWTRISLPDGVSPDVIDVSGPRWLLTSLEFDSLARIFYSDDEGANWSEVTLETATTGEPPTLVSALVSGEDLVIVVKGAVDREGQNQQVLQFISEQGLVPSDAKVGGWAIQGNTLCFFVEEPDDTRTFGMCHEQPDGAGQTQDFAADPYPYSFELSNEELDTIDRYRAAKDQVQVYTSDGDPLSLTASYESWHTTATSDAEGFYIGLTTPTDELLITSPDGVDWTETSIDSLSGRDGTQMTTRIDNWFVNGSDQGLTVQSLGQLQDPTANPITIPGMQHLASLEIGPFATAAVVYPPATDSGQSSPQIGWSRDGNAWNWQNPSEAFGISEGEASVDLAVGDDYVLAYVTGFAAVADSDSVEAQPPRWFMATVQ